MTRENKEKILAALDRCGLAIEFAISMSEALTGKTQEEAYKMREIHNKLIDCVKAIETKEIGTDASIPNP